MSLKFFIIRQIILLHPTWIVKLMHIILNITISTIIVLGLLLMVAFAILLERKILATIQKRRGPNSVGLLGILQPIADAVKLILKETIIPQKSEKKLYIIAPILSLVLSLLNWSIIPFSEVSIYADIRISLLMFFALSTLTVYGIVMSGWSSNSKYAFLGALRAAAQVIAYEVSMGITLIAVVMLTQSLNYSQIILYQASANNIMSCFIFFILNFITILAETNRTPFDLPEAEAELVAGYNVEYSAMAFGYFFLGEYISIWTVSAVNVMCFFGGYTTILGCSSILWFSWKLITVVSIFIWVRGSLPRYRYDQLMNLGWKIILPLTLGFLLTYIGLILMITWFLEKYWEEDNILSCENWHDLKDWYSELFDDDGNFRGWKNKKLK